MKLDLSFATAARVLPKEYGKLKIYLVGAGGTGSFAAMNLARLIYELRRTGKAVELTIIDDDLVEESNIPRSNFCAAEIGRFKAQTLAERISLAWGLETGWIGEKLDFEAHLNTPRSRAGDLTILVGCVDNHLARGEIRRCVEELNKFDSQNAPQCWWIDGGNGRSSGQVLIGSDTRDKKPESCFSGRTICRQLPAPSVLHPELLDDQELLRPHETAARLSCAERIARGEQGLNINNRVAVEIGEILTELLLTNSLRRFASYFDLESGTAQSIYCTPESLSAALRQAAGRGSRPRHGTPPDE